MSQPNENYTSINDLDQKAIILIFVDPNYISLDKQTLFDSSFRTHISSRNCTLYIPVGQPIIILRHIFSLTEGKPYYFSLGYKLI